MTFNIRTIAFYLPQFHPIPENDVWWGKGFTEWTNVSKARPLFLGHRQPNLPTDLGFYDLRLSEARNAQADMAREHGIEAFCYWHYWFHGRRLIERPFNEVLRSGEPNFPFCLAWANETWSRRWLGEEKDILLQQSYSPADDLNHIRWLLPVFSDPRCVKVKDRPLFLVYRPMGLPDPQRTTDLFRNECIRSGLPEPYLLGINAHCVSVDCRLIGFDGTVNFTPQLGNLPDLMNDDPSDSKLNRNRMFGVESEKLKIYDYEEALVSMLCNRKRCEHYTHPSIFIGWDNTPRRGENGIILLNNDPAIFGKHLKELAEEVQSNPVEERFVFLNAWNEWAEGNHLEPGNWTGRAFLQEVGKVTAGSGAAVPEQSASTYVPEFMDHSEAFETAVKALAFYLPQYHPIPENDEWWGKGFTEWTNVANARPHFPGHYQPHLPGELGFYDLRLPEVRQAQADLAREYGIHGFCYYHYWFNGKLILQRPLHDMLRSGAPDMPFCLCWANEPWTRAWDGRSGDVLLDQQYGEEDDREHIRYLAQFFRDSRYIRIDGRPLFLVYRANHIPDPCKAAENMRDEARKLGIGELYLCRVESFPNEHNDPSLIGFDAAVEFQPDWTWLPKKLSSPAYGDQSVYSYEELVNRMMAKKKPEYQRFPCVTPSWDNFSRRKTHGTIFTGSTPRLYEKWLRHAITRTQRDNPDCPLVFINAWNEWGEGNHLEPDQVHGRAYLEATGNALVDADHLFETDDPAEAPEALRKLEECLVEHERILAEHGQAVAAYKNELAQKDRLLADHEQAVAEKERLIAECLRLLADREQQINSLLDSMSWKITAPLRAIAKPLMEKKD